MKKNILFMVLFAVLFISSVVSGEQPDRTKQKFQDIEDLYSSKRISKEQYIKMKQNIAELERRDKNRQDKNDMVASQSEINLNKSLYLEAYKDNIITKSQFVKMCRFHDQYSTDTAILKSSELLEAEGNFDAFNEWAKIKGPEMQTKQQTTPDYSSSQSKSSYIGMKCPYCGATSDSRGMSPNEEGNCRECLKTYSVAEGRKTYEEYVKTKPPSKDYANMLKTYQHICDTQGREAGQKYFGTLTHEELEGCIAYAKAKQGSQATMNVIGNVLGAAANVFQQNAQQAQQQANEIQRNRPKTTTGTIRPDYSGGYTYRETTQ